MQEEVGGLGAGAASVRRLCLVLCSSHPTDSFKGWAGDTMTLEKVLDPVGHSPVSYDRGRDQ